MSVKLCQSRPGYPARLRPISPNCARASNLTLMNNAYSAKRVYKQKKGGDFLCKLSSKLKLR